ncbi:MAG: YfjI family protein [Magnetospirillum sp.]|nr:YfjI family protein [Magnetospirillum sp.]
MPPPTDYPVNALGNLLGGAARAIHDMTQAPMAIGAQSVLAVAALATQAHFSVLLPHGALQPISLFCLTIAESGERKSGCDRLAKTSVGIREKELRRKFDKEMAQYNDALAAWSALRKKVLASAKVAPTVKMAAPGDDARPPEGDDFPGEPGPVVDAEHSTKRENLEGLHFHRTPDSGNDVSGVAAMQAALAAIGDKPKMPLAPILTAPEPTYEGLVKALVVGQPSMGIFSDEGGGFIGGHGMSKESKTRTMSGLNGLWDGQEIKRIRAAENEITSLFGRRISVHLMAQPIIANTLLSDPEADGIGLLARFLIAAPAPASGTRFERPPSALSESDLRRYEARALELLRHPLPLVEGKENELEPRSLPLSVEAGGVYVEFKDHVEAQLGPDGAFKEIKPFANKAAEHAARIAAVMTVFEDRLATEISGVTMARGITLVNFYLGEAVRLVHAAKLSTPVVAAKRALDWLHDHGWHERPSFSTQELYQRGPTFIREAALARAVLATLVDHGWAHQVDPGSERSGWKLAGPEAAP